MYDSALRRWRGENVPANATEAVRRFQIAARLGHAGAQYRLARACFSGRGRRRNPSVGRRWLTAAATGGHPYAMYDLSLLLPFEQGFDWLCRAAQAGFPPAEFALGLRAYRGDGVAEDVEVGLNWIRRAAQADHAAAIEFLRDRDAAETEKNRNRKFDFVPLQLGIAHPLEKCPECQVPLPSAADECPRCGLLLLKSHVSPPPAHQPTRSLPVVPPVGTNSSAAQAMIRAVQKFNRIRTDPAPKQERAVFLGMRRAAELGSPTALSFLGACFDRGIGVRQNRQAALECWEHAAEYDEPRALFTAGIRYLKGEDMPVDWDRGIEYMRRAAAVGCVPAARELFEIFSVDETTERNVGEATRYLERAAELGDGESANKLAHLHLHEGREAEAVEWFRRADKAGNSDAQCTLGWAYYKGLFNLAVDFAKARALFRKSADAGCMESLNNLGEMYEHGDGVRKNVRKAVELYKRAMRTGRCASAEINLGKLYWYGTRSIPRQPRTAAMLLELALEHADSRHEEDKPVVELILKERDMIMAKLLTRDEVTVESLNDLLEMSYETQVDQDEGQIFLQEIQIRVILDAEKKLVKLSALVSVPEKTSSAKALQFVNDCNSTYIIVKAELLKPEDGLVILFEYDLDYYHGLIPSALVRLINRFNDIVEACIAKGNEEKIFSPGNVE